MTWQREVAAIAGSYAIGGAVAEAASLIARPLMVEGREWVGEGRGLR